jgi:hypothetical protein
LAAPHPALALETAAPGAAAAQTGTITYPASFFAPMGLDTAFGMVRRIAGFTFDGGSAARSARVQRATCSSMANGPPARRTTSPRS